MSTAKFASDISLAKTYFRETISAGEAAELLVGFSEQDFEGDRAAPISGVAAFKVEPHATGLSETLFFAVSKVFPEKASLPSNTVICSPDNRDRIFATAKIIVDDPRAAFIHLINQITVGAGIDFGRTIEDTARIVKRGKFKVHPTAIIEDDVVIGEDAEIGPYAVIRRGSIIGEGTLIHSAAIVGEVGMAIHIAADGTLLDQPHVGTVYIGAQCKMGAQSMISRGILGATRVDNKSRLGNFVYVSHGVELGERSWIAHGTLIGGHTKFGDHVSVGMGATIRDNLMIGGGASVAMGAVVTKSVPERASVIGNPAKIVNRQLIVGPK